ncbi:MAG: class III poly(R)-hydroxyalkanoic acid synthase subunit PhaC [Dokdonella sp.]|uniref:class III poly(R)-hydroxyalkanoic acid synthase subunit PhaC n=1 Tax=Dokdonella sp. TaxID=2291710 RepID=UPI0025BC2EA1|nr:class III poly(R)-hydroxyalkanoic acid synthase subunit PhaC [Dokdonella sp.]MBX3700592.1 class III poly(R)-hydroxyalkanoic acid synthase subunit PhaC [Dokdonella sp.]MCW5578752.1 class III poly(R)-hydroxyalkanoic acid synthase subunit PhaC [Dokdonella sp.]
MQPIRIEPAKAMDEVLTTQRKLAAALDTLRSMDDVDFGVTAKEEIYREDKVVVYRFKGERAPTAKVPILIVYALVNRPYMVDLQDDRSLVKNLLAKGEDVYLIDWGYPDAADRWLTLDDYINGYIKRAVDAVARHRRLRKINLLGICQGGAFSLCFAALHPARVQNLITMVTPVDFQTPDNMLSNWVQKLDIDLFVDTLGNVPADLMNLCYLMLKPVRLNQQKYIGLVDILDNKVEMENFLRMEKWIFDSPDQAGEAFRQFLKDFYQGNKLVKGGLRIGGQEVHLGNITMPVLNVFAEQDHLVPPAASRVLGEHVGTKDYTQLAFRGGHIGIYVSGRAQREVPPAIHDWLAARC